MNSALLNTAFYFKCIRENIIPSYTTQFQKLQLNIKK